MTKYDRIKDFFIDNKKTYTLGLLWLLSVDIAQLILPKLLGNLTDSFEAGTMNTNILLRYSILIFITGVFTGIGRYFWRMYISGNSAKLDYTLRKDLFGHFLSLSPNYFYTHKTGDLMSHATNDITTVRRSLGISTIMFLDSLFIIVIALFMMIRTTSLKLTMIVAINLPIIIIVTKHFGNIVYDRSKKVQQSFSELTQTTQESYSGIRVSKAFAQEDLVYEHFKEINKDNYDKNLELVKVSGFFGPLIRFIFSLSILITIFYGGREVIHGHISLGDFIAFNSYLAMLHWPTRAIGQIINNIQRGTASLDRLNNIFYEEPEIKEASNPVQVSNLEGLIEFDSVNFKYPKSSSINLDNVNFKVKPGETLAIVGKTGSGKSTIPNVLLRLYDINDGEILIDKINIKDLSLKDLRENIAYVSQDNFLFSNTIRNNIAFSFDDVDSVPDYKIHQAAKKAAVYDNIIDFPDQFDTVLGERGITLSGGQKQRTAMARAFIKKAPILILDDSLSAVDTETEEDILNNINEFSHKQTKIIISHRISTIQDANEIIVLDDGKIVERGTHEELININGVYNHMYNQQLLDKVEEGFNG